MTKLRTLLFLLVLLCLPAGSMHAQQDTLFGTRVTVEGTVSEIVSEYGFILEDVRPFDITPDRMLVFPDSREGFVIDINEGMTVQATGIIDEFSRENVEARTDYTLDEDPYRPYSTNDYQVVATFVEDVETLSFTDPTGVDVDFINGIEADPSIYFEQEVTLDGTVVDILSPNAFLIRDTQPFTLAPQEIVVFDDNTAGFGVDINIGRRVQINGVFYPFDLSAVDSLTTYDVDIPVFGSFAIDDYALIASSVSSARLAPVSTQSVETPDVNPTPATTDETDNTETTNTPQPSALSMDIIEDNPQRYIGDFVTISGEVERIFSSTSFLLEEQEFFDLNPLQIIAFSESGVGFPVIVEDGMLVEVTGTLYSYNAPELVEALAFELDTTLYDDFDDVTVTIIIEEIEVLAEPTIIR